MVYAQVNISREAEQPASFGGASDSQFSDVPMVRAPAGRKPLSDRHTMLLAASAIRRKIVKAYRAA
jgi:hypothetical protein